ncbi:PQQ-binding-like beta-propeller repeat protein [Brevibacillus sp. B_LB10_24]|uniref:outer membrane protein assembly factor BamB family protein n=1 Tax=Brevibacillus sp. B_LB10_24 TaxID=3380645 RepID=UPI0038B9F70D
MERSFAMFAVYKKKWLYIVFSSVFLMASLLSFQPAAAGSNDKERWRFTTGDVVVSSAAIGQDGTIYVGSFDHNLYAVDKKGKEKWRFETEDSIISSPAIGADGTIYVGSWDNRLYAVNPENGKKKWHFETGDKISSSPAIGADGTIYVGSWDNRLYAINPENGKKKWHFETGNVVSSSPAIGADGTIYVGSNDKKLYAIKPNGTKKWEFAAGDAVSSSPSISEDGTAIYVGSNDSNLYAINPGNGKEKWHFKTGDQVISSPAIGSDGTIYVGSYDMYLYAVNPKDGGEKWRFPTGGYLFSSPAIGADGTIYIGSGDKRLYAVKSNGKEKWHFETEGEIGSSPAIGPDGAVYIGSYDKNVYAIGMVSVSEINLNKTELTVNVGQSETLQATVMPEDASFQEIKWSSKDSGIAKVDDSGKVTGVKPGKTTITATSEDGGYFKQCVVIVTEAKDPPVSDVSLSDISGHWAEKNIIQAVNKGIVKGYPDGTFKPDHTVTRAEFAVLLMNALQPSGKGSALVFTDKETIGSWAAKEIAQCVELGIINGYPDNTFRPNKTITHADMITMVVRAANLPTASDAASGYLDDADIPDYARSKVAAAKLYGITSYITGNRFEPHEPSTRAESITAIMNMLRVKK